MISKFWLRILVSLAGALALALLIWFAAPLVSFGGAHPFEEPPQRLALIGLMLALVGGAGALRLMRRRAGAERIAASLAEDGDAPVLAERMKEALGVLRARGGRANYLYDLPWYLLIGPPGSGKTTALVNSGLEFPLAEGLTPDSVKGVGGTRYCDWWFTEDAVLIDTAGRYTTQDSDTRADHKSWLAFLDLLKKNRPRQPINGVLVAISLEDLLTLPAAEVDAHAQAIRARLVELADRLKVDFPVYALFTKADLVIGFMEFFGDLDEDGRAQVFGATFQTMDKTKSMLFCARPEFAALLDPLNRLAEKRLDEEKDVATRALAFGFPAQMAALEKPVLSFLDAIFDPSRYRIAAPLRGFYFTSGTQQGAPIDQLIGALSKSFGAEAAGARLASGQGRSFFLGDLLKKVVFGEAGWVSTGRARRLARLSAFAALLVATPLALFGLWLAYARNLDRLDHFEEAVAAYPAASRGVGAADEIADRDLSKALPALHALRYLPGGYAETKAAQGGSELGLNQSARLRSAAETAYGVGLERMLRPRLVYRLEELLAGAGDPSARFDALKVYLMLGGLERVDRDLLVSFMERDWSETLYPGPKNAEGRKELEQHLTALIDLESGRAPRVGLDGPLVEKAQAAIAAESVSTRALRLMETQAKATLRPDWTAVKAGGPGALIVFEPSVESVAVPYFYTRAGYEGFLKGLPATIEEMERDRWVLGAAGRTPEMAAQYDKLQETLADAYATNFIAAWKSAIDALKARPLTSDRPAYPALTAAASVTSPVARLLESIRDETQLEADGASVVGASGETPAARIDAALAPYHKLVAGDPGARIIDRALAELNELRLDLTRLAVEPGAQTGLAERVESGVARMKTQTGQLPPPFAAMAARAGDEILAEIGAAGAAQTMARLRNEIALTCQEKIASRYPFDKDAVRDVELEDFARVFGPGGLIDAFVSGVLAPAVDMSGPQWTWRGDGPLSRQIPPEALADFRRAGEIRAAYFPGDSAAPGFNYAVTPPAVSGVRLDIDATSIQGGSGAAQLVWPGAAEYHRALLTMRSSAAQPPMLLKQGLWSVLRLLDAAEVDGQRAVFSLGGKSLAFRFAATPANPQAGLKPFDLEGLRAFRCPGGS
ncbi:type VI secretion system membrane subunit TssM [Methylocella sp.]|uniref:type VI secretion system membrane subunit TssM n=1 Tax=Methylocella sp. TaxID=1978226 RepID=UPI003783C453